MLHAAYVGFNARTGTAVDSGNPTPLNYDILSLFSGLYNLRLDFGWSCTSRKESIDHPTALFTSATRADPFLFPLPGGDSSNGYANCATDLLHRHIPCRIS